MRVKRPQCGFTIVETLLVLMVTSALFVSVAFMLSGKRGHTEFSQSIQDIRAAIQQVINDVGSGNYANTNDFKCTDPTNGGGNASSLPPVISAGSGTQGSNTNCIFLGKVIQFGVTGTDPEQYRIYTVVGAQYANNEEVGLDPNGHYSEARPVISPPGGANAPRIGRLEYGLKTLDNGMYYGSPRQNVGAIAFVKSLGSYGINGTLDSGSQQVNVVPINGTALRATPDPSKTVNAVNINDPTNKPGQGLADSPVNPSSGVNICFVSSSTIQSGLITIGGNNRQLSATVSIKDNQTCS